jgi:hypothetical protein
MLIPKPVRIEPAFDNREQIRTMFLLNAPYRAIAAYAPEGVDPETKRSALPMFRGNWAVGGKPLVKGAEDILHNRRFLDAARSLYGTSHVYPEFVLVNINAPMPAGTTHVDVPSFHGATREHFSLPFLKVMGDSELFEAWRVVRAGALSWFYDGTGGSFDYWPDGIDGAMLSEQAPFGNVALLADNDRMYHRIGPIGDHDPHLPHMSASAHIEPRADGSWEIREDGEVRAAYPSHAIRLSVLWKAEVRDRKPPADSLTIDRIMAILTADLRRRSVDFEVPSNPFDTAWILLLQDIYSIRDPASRVQV